MSTLIPFRVMLDRGSIDSLAYAVIALDAGQSIVKDSPAHRALSVLVDALAQADSRPESTDE